MKGTLCRHRPALVEQSKCTAHQCARAVVRCRGCRRGGCCFDCCCFGSCYCCCCCIPRYGSACSALLQSFLVLQLLQVVDSRPKNCRLGRAADGRPGRVLHLRAQVHGGGRGGRQALFKISRDLRERRGVLLFGCDELLPVLCGPAGQLRIGFAPAEEQQSAMVQLLLG